MIESLDSVQFCINQIQSHWISIIYVSNAKIAEMETWLEDVFDGVHMCPTDAYTIGIDQGDAKPVVYRSASPTFFGTRYAINTFTDVDATTTKMRWI